MGAKGEKIATEHLQAKGYKLIATNYRRRQGEIDLIFTDLGQLVFVEVKTRRSEVYGTPAESIDRRKLEHLQKTAHLYLSENPQYKESWRIDLIAVKLSGKQICIAHLKNILND